MTTPAPTTTANYKTVTTKYYPNSGIIESTTRESVGLLEGRKAENLTASIRKHTCIQKSLCYTLIPLTIIGTILLIITIVITSLSKSNYINPALAVPTTLCLGAAFGLGMIYCVRKEESITVSSEIIKV